MATDWHDDELLVELYRTHQRKLRQFAAGMVGAADATDVVQEVMLRAWRSRPEVSDELSAWPWLRIVAERVAIDMLRRRRETPTTEVVIEEAQGWASDEPEAAGLRAGTRQQLREALGMLSPREAEILLLSTVAEQSPTEIASRYGSNANAVRQQLFRARRNLARHYRKLGGAMPALLPAGARWRRLLRRAQAAHAPGIVMAAGLALVLIFPLPGDDCVMAVDYPTSWLTGRQWVPGPPDRPLRPWTDAAVTYDVGRHEYVAMARQYDAARRGNELGDPAVKTWAWTVAGWGKRQPPRPLQALQFLATAYDSDRKRVVLVGWNQDKRMETWTWDGTRWTRQSVGGPAIREGAALVYFPPSRRLVLFGGQFKSLLGAGGPGSTTVTSSDETWVWDGTTWQRQSPAVSPPARHHAATVYDAERREIVLFGGTGPGGEEIALDDTWIWDGTTWSGRPPGTSPPARYGAVLVDTPNGPLLHGGSGLVEPFLGDSWLWNGGTGAWVKWSDGPPGRDLHGAYDPDRDEVMIWGSMVPGSDGATRSTYFLRGLRSVSPTPAPTPRPGRSLTSPAVHRQVTTSPNPAGGLPSRSSSSSPPSAADCQ